MYTGNLSLLRLTELHEEWAHHAFAAHDAGLEGLDEFSDRYQREADRIDAEIRARVARQARYAASCPFCKRALFWTNDYIVAAKMQSWTCPGNDYLCSDKLTQGFPAVKNFGNLRLAFGIPDAERAYPRKDKGRHWTNHARHAIPFEGCHLCQREGAR